MSETNMSELELRIKKIKAKREQLVSQKAEKVARLKAAQEELKNLRDKASEAGYELNELPTILADKKTDLNAKVALIESALEEVEDKLSKYDV